jgi:protein tyrosine phosphatase (PTP) superfamily phosphohydrolase (DUF442 family)
MSDPRGILNWRRLDDRITTSGQPDEAGLAAIRDLGVVHVVNLALHTHPKALSDQAGSVAALGMKYTHIPVDFDNPTEDDFDRFCAIMASAADVPVHVHCIVNARVTAFVYRWQRDVLGAGEADARAIMDSVWRPGGVWAEFLGDGAAMARESAFAGRDYQAPAFSSETR